jgi:ribonuclease BN (tRNA processing enzyme)
MATPDPNAGTLTWLGHSCAAIRLDGLVIVTDPVLRSRVVHLRRKEPVARGAVDGVGVVLISHSHYDHLDLPSLDRLDPEAQVLVPAGAGGLLRRRGFSFVREVVAGDEVDVGAVRVRVTHAEHASGFRVGTGKTQPVGVYEVLDYHTDESFPNLMEVVNHFKEGRKHYRSGSWDSATRSFKECLKANEHDKLSQVYVERCELLRANSPSQWDGVWRLTSK